MSVAPGYLLVVTGVLKSGKCFCPSQTPERYGNYKGPGTPLPFCAEIIHLPPRHAAWRRWRFAVARRSIGLSHFPKALGAPGGALADMARGERAGQIALHGLRFRCAVSSSLGVITCASHRKSLSAGAFRASSLPAGACSDDANAWRRA